MTDTASLALLKTIGRSYANMAAFAERLDWKGVNAEWGQAAPMLAELRKVPLDRLPSHERTEAIRLIAELLAFTEKVSDRALPWLDQARPLLDSFRKYPLNPDQRLSV